MMKTSLKGVLEIAGHEGIVLEPYQDSVGVWTVGIGHTAAAGPPNPDPDKFGPRKLTVVEAVEILRRDLSRFEEDVREAFDKPLKQHEFDAAVSFHFNTGAIKRAWWVKSWNKGDRSKAYLQILNWLIPPEIYKRRKAEQVLFEKGEYSKSGLVPLYQVGADGLAYWKSVDLKNYFTDSGQLPPEPEKAAGDLILQAINDRLKSIEDRLAVLEARNDH